MSTDVRPAVRSRPVEEIEEEIVHEMCCDDDIALCGTYVPGDEWVDEDEEITCPLCRLVKFCPKCGDQLG